MGLEVGDKSSRATEGELPIKKFSTAGSTKFGLEGIWADGAKLHAITKTRMAIQLSQLAWKSFVANPLTAFLTLLTVSLVLTLFGAFILILQNISVGVATSTTGVELRVFLSDGTSDSDVAKLKSEISGHSTVKSVRVVSKQMAIEEFRKALGEDAALLDGLENENPLPASLEVTFKASEEVEATIDSFAKKYREFPGVAHIQYSQSLVGQLGEILRVVRWGGLVTLLLMVAVTAFVVATTIRLAMYAHRQEIQIMRLVGATSRFIRAPFLLEGVAEGFLGSCIAMTLLVVIFRSLSAALSGSQIVTALGIHLRFLSPMWILLFLILGPVLGLVGSFLAVRRFSEE